MYCSQCGKKVMKTMLFCPFCGSPIVIPNQESAENSDTALEASAFAGKVRAADECVGASVSPEEKLVFAEAETTEEPVREVVVSEPISFEWDLQTESEANNQKLSENARHDEGERFGKLFEDAGRVSETSEAPRRGSLFDDQHDARVDRERKAMPQRKQSSAGRRIYDAESAEEFHPLKLKDESVSEPETQVVVPEEAEKSPEIEQGHEQPVRLEGHAPQLSGMAANPRNRNQRSGETPQSAKQSQRLAQHGRTNNTLVPSKSLDMNDIFLDSDDDPDEYDEFDDFDVEDYGDDADYAYEDEEDNSFVVRHIRGIVGFSLLAILLLIFGFYAFSDTGQVALARVNLAWNADVYSRLGYESYQKGQYDLAGSYYEKALARDTDRYSYASSAANSYVTGNNTEKAAIMLKKCIQISPEIVEPYIYLMNLYPDAATRPWDVTQLVRQGYERTGDARLNIESSAQ